MKPIRFLAVTLSVLLAVPAWGAPEIVGTAAAGHSATVNGTALEPGTAVVSGDTITVGPSGGAWIALAGGGRLYAAASSELRLEQSGGRTRFELLRGEAAFRLADDPVAGRLADATFRSADGRPTVGVVEVRNSSSGILYAEQGTLVVSTAANARLTTLRAGDYLPVGAPDSKASNESHTGRNVLIVAMILGGTATAIGVILGHSEARRTASP